MFFSGVKERGFQNRSDSGSMVVKRKYAGKRRIKIALQVTEQCIANVQTHI